MTIARKQLICLESTPYYHCISRCVRRAFLCGFDRYTNQSYEHRREWVESLILKLSQAFCIDVAAYAVMSNHYHLVLHINQSTLNGLSPFEIIDRWAMLYSLPALVRQYRHGDTLEPAQMTIVSGYLEKYRENLLNISQFMGYLNERIARQANAEDHCTGRFWEGRFKSQALLDEQALIQCMAYVDLNPIRANIAKTPEQSDYTSIQRRIRSMDAGQSGKSANKKPCNAQPQSSLMPFQAKGDTETQDQNTSDNPIQRCLPFHFLDYLELVDWTGRHLPEGKTGLIAADVPPILDRLGMSSQYWVNQLKPVDPDSNNNRPSWMPKALGSKAAMAAYCQMIGQNWVWSAVKSKPT